MEELSKSYLTKKQAVEKYSFLSENMLKNLLFKDIEGFRSKVVRRLGRRILLDEHALLQFIADSSESNLSSTVVSACSQKPYLKNLKGKMNNE